MTQQIVARFVFQPDRASEFLFDEGQLVTELHVDSIEEVMEYVLQFDDALEDAIVLVPGGINEETGKRIYNTVSLLDSTAAALAQEEAEALAKAEAEAEEEEGA